ncbi:C5a peptidase [Pontiella desulfatans]|uniref:C5a peptidase n=1 Tax=Pontiella desulfatans TaxID=2750659 RepID=A0A6C2U9F7_PONDE|nr:S8 family serine peptidase [Pontiella desulfatans]VGO16742.1 C5a peptidase [Pontiella desulfatans]
MKTGRTRPSTGFQPLEAAGLALFFLAAQAMADRSSRAQEAAGRAALEKAEAQAWAWQRGIEPRFDDGGNVIEIMALRNGRPLFNTTFNKNAAISTTANAVRNTAPFGVDGAGVVVGVWDGGSVMTNHQEFGNRVVAQDVVSAHYHASHVGGTIAASGIVTNALGMAPSAAIDSYDWNSDDSEMISAAASAAGQPGKLHLSNHSYGYISGWYYAYWTNPWTRRSGYHWWGDIHEDEAEAAFGQYNTYTRSWDSIVYNAPYFLPFKAAGNERNDNPTEGSKVYYSPDGGTTWTNAIYDASIHPGGDGAYKNGYDSIPYRGNAKNILTVGAVTDAVVDGERALTNVSLLGFTSWGPADDGRIKPDIVANGDQLYSCNQTATNAYATRSGTSMSSPNACGSAALLVDYYDDLFPGGAMRASTLKALIIHTADDLGRPGPDYQFGWGLMNTLKAGQLLADYSNGNPVRLTEAKLSSTNESNAYVCYADGSGPVRVTLCWTDPPGASTWEHDSRTPALVNDLDLKVTGPGGTFHPFQLSYEDPEANATAHAKNQVDNVEQVYIGFPESGHYTITVDHEGALQNGTQHYSLLTSGLMADQDGDGLPDNWEAGFFASATGGEAAADADGDGYDNLAEYIAGTDPTDPASVFGIAAVESLQPVDGHPPFVVEWNSMPGRVYNVYWTYHLKYLPFSNISGELRWPINSFTDSVEHVGFGQYYKIDVRMDD